jgi:hypothetical protein
MAQVGDIFTRLIMDTAGFSNKLGKSKAEVDAFSAIGQKMGAGMISVFGKITGAVGIAGGAFAAFEKTMASTATTQGLFNRGIADGTAVVDSFFASIATGNFDGFLNGLDDIVAKADDAAQAIGALKMEAQLGSAQNSRLGAQYTILLNKARDPRNQKNGKAEQYAREAESLIPQMASANTRLSQTYKSAGYRTIVSDLYKVGVHISPKMGVLESMLSETEVDKNRKLAAAYKAKMGYFNNKITGSQERMVTGPDASTTYVDTEQTKYWRAQRAKYLKSNTGKKNQLAWGVVSGMTHGESSGFSKGIEMLNQGYSLDAAASGYETQVGRAMSRAQRARASYLKKLGGGGKTGGTGKVNPLDNAPAGSMAGIDSRIKNLSQTLELTVNPQSRIKVQQEIDDLTGKKRVIQLETEFHARNDDKNGLAKLPKSYMTDAQEFYVHMAEESEQTKKNLNSLKVPEINTDVFAKMAQDTLGISTEMAKMASERKGIADVTQVLGEMGNALSATGNKWMAFGGQVASSLGQVIQLTYAAMLASGLLGEKKKQEAIASGVASAAQTPVVGWILAGVALAEMIALIATMPKYAHGGVVGGNKFSGDKVPVLANSGEIILNRAQQNSIAGQLSSSAGEAATGVTVRGEDLYISLGNTLRRRGAKTISVK